MKEIKLLLWVMGLFCAMIVLLMLGESAAKHRQAEWESLPMEVKAEKETNKTKLETAKVGDLVVWDDGSVFVI